MRKILLVAFGACAGAIAALAALGQAPADVTLTRLDCGNGFNDSRRFTDTFQVRSSCWARNASSIRGVSNIAGNVIVGGKGLGGGDVPLGAVAATDEVAETLRRSSLVGLAAVFVAAAAFVSPEAFGIGSPGHIKTQSLVEMGLGTAIGAITFTGSIVAFAKLQGLVSGSPLIFKGQHALNAAIGEGASQAVTSQINSMGTSTLAAISTAGIAALTSDQVVALTSNQ